MNILLKKNKISQQIHDKTLNFFSTNNFIENNLVKNELNGQLAQVIIFHSKYFQIFINFFKSRN